MAVLVAYSLAFLPVAQQPGPVWPNFVGIYQTAIVVCDLLTAALLLLQFLHFRQVAMLVLGAGYLFTALIAVIHLLSFPGVFSPQGLIGGSQTTNWLWIMWHAGFPLFVLGYAVADRWVWRADRVQARAMSWWAAAATVGLVGVCAALSAGGGLPQLITGLRFTRINESGLGPALVLLCLGTLILTARARGRSVINLWLAVAMLAFMLDILQNLNSGARFTIGWYVARGNSLVGSVLILAVYVVEMGVLLRHWHESSATLSEANAKLLASNAALLRAKEEAERANHAKSQFLASASHDLRQPVQSLYFFHEALASKLRNHPAAPVVANMQSALDALRGLLDALLDISKLHAGIVAVEFSTFAVADVLGRVAAEHGARAAALGVGLRVVPSSAWVRSDKAQLERILRNLVDNALKYTPVGGEVLVGCRRAGRELRLVVADTGPGIPQESQSAVFEEFVQLGNPERDRAKGLGLGLAIVRHLARLLGHRVELRSQVGSGTSVSVAVPLVRVRRKRATSLRRRSPNGANGLALVIDDEALLLVGMRSMLEQWGWEVMAAGSGAEAVRLVARTARAPDVIIADYRLRNETGVRVIRDVHGVCGLRIPAVVLTGDTGPESIAECAGSEFPLLHKPVDAGTLHATLVRLRA